MMPCRLPKLQMFFEKIRKSKHIQIILGIMPGLFCFLFTSAFLVDTLNVFGTLSINNTYVAESQKHNMLLDVEEYNSILNIIKTPDTFTVTPDSEGFICNIEVDGLGYAFHNDFQRGWIPEVIFVNYDTSSEQYYINNSEDGFVEPQDDILCKVYYQDDKFYVIDKQLNKTELEDVLNFEVNEDGTVLVKPMYYEPINTDSNLYFVSCLEDDILHYDGLENIYVRNATKDFLKNFLVGTNVLFFVLVVILYVCALIYANMHYHLEYFTSKPVIAVNVVGMIALLFGLLLAVILLI